MNPVFVLYGMESLMHQSNVDNCKVAAPDVWIKTITIVVFILAGAETIYVN